MRIETPHYNIERVRGPCKIAIAMTHYAVVRAEFKVNMRYASGAAGRSDKSNQFAAFHLLSANNCVALEMAVNSVAIELLVLDVYAYSASVPPVPAP